MKSNGKLAKQCGLCEYYQSCHSSWGLCTINPPQAVSVAVDGVDMFRWFSPTVPLNRKACQFFKVDPELKLGTSDEKQRS